MYYIFQRNRYHEYNIIFKTVKLTNYTHLLLKETPDIFFVTQIHYTKDCTFFVCCTKCQRNTTRSARVFQRKFACMNDILRYKLNKINDL